LLEGEDVCLSILGLSSPGGESPRIKVVGELRKIGYSGVDGFAVGDSGRVLLHGPDFVSASLETFEGNNFFAVEMRFGEVSFFVGDRTTNAGQEFLM
jgi:hypothetical protein